MYGVTGDFLVDVKVNGITYPVGEGRLKRLRLHEMATYMSPMAELGFDDRLNFLVELVPMTGTEVWEIGIGDSRDNIIYHEFRTFKDRAQRSGSDSHLVKLYLLSNAARGLFTPGRREGYQSQKISSVVSAIAAALGLETEVEETRGEYDLFCPGWTYAQFLAWLADRARSSGSGTAGFLYFVNLEDELHFCSPEWVKKREPVIHLVRKDPAHEDQYDEKDVGFHSYRIHQNPWLMGGQGAFGLTAAFFDFESGEFTDQPMTVDGSVGVIPPAVQSGFTSHTEEATLGTSLIGLGDDLSLLNTDLDPQTVLLDQGVALGSDDVELRKVVAEAKLLRAVNSMVKLEVLLDGDLRVRAGELVSVELGSPHPENVINQVFSGKWVVERVTHQLIPQFLTKALLFRPGVGGSDDPRLVSPPGGVI